jgi:beta-glucosidase
MKLDFLVCIVAVAVATPTRAAESQPPVQARAKPILTIDGLRFKDANNNGKLDRYEDWRLPVADRVADLLTVMTLEEKAGMMLIDTLNAAPGGGVPENATALVREQHMTRFIFRNVIAAEGAPGASPGARGPRGGEGAPGARAGRSATDGERGRDGAGAPGREGGRSGRGGRGGRGGAGGFGGGGFGGGSTTPRQAAEFTNAVQELAEGARLGIPVVFKSNARNHYERQARAGINEAAGAMSTWPKEAGLAATRDMATVRAFARAMGAEWNAIGLRGAYAYMADLATEPRWFRVHETFTEDADLAAEIMRVLVQELQGGPVNRNTKVALTLKHFPGGGPQEWGLDPHYTFGKNQVYPAGRFADHLKPFRAAIDAGVASIMPYYGVPIHLEYEGTKYQPVGMAFSGQIVNDLLRGQLGFRGYVNSDTGVINSRAWGLENKSERERVAAAINAGTDVLSGFRTTETIVDLVQAGLVANERVDRAVARLLHEQFALGLFENPYVDAAAADSIVGKAEFREQALAAQRKSIVLLQNRDQLLPLRSPAAGTSGKLYTLGFDVDVVRKSAPGYSVVAGTAGTGARTPVPAGTNYALLRVEISNPREATGTYRSGDAATGGLINPATGKAWGAEDATGLDDGIRMGGALPWEAGMISFSAMAHAKSWRIEPSLADIQAVMKEVGDPGKVVVCVYFRQPYVLDEESGMRKAGALVATFGVSDEAMLDVLLGRAKPQGKLPFALARSLAAVEANDPDAPGYPEKDTLFPFGFGLSY